ncbi:histidine kinase dimerization/phospho-acceptor domain-containing protein [Cetobacterium somerae]|jgi:signal transduction histidine kinase|uniref:sensor histidine kinase n=1 Tax=Cetobacterium somerae TaxID=188913 RepID=UPI003D767A55
MSLIKVKVNLFTKIFGFSIFLVLTTILINYVFNALFLEKFYVYRKKEMMLKVIENAKIVYETKSSEDFDNYIYDIKESTGIDIDVKNLQKKHTMMSSHMMMRRTNSIQDIPYNKFVAKEFLGNDAKILYYGEEVSDKSAIFVSTSLSVIQSHSHESNVFNFITAILALIVSLASGLIFSKRITKDITYLNEKASKISQLDFPDKIEINRNDEIGELSLSLNKMSQELSSSIKNLKSFVSNASHELRTPVSIICTHATALLEHKDMNINEQRKYYNIILKVGNEMKELIENLLTLSKLDNTVFKVKNESINLKLVIEDALEKYDILELEKDISVNVNIKDKKITCDPRIIKLVINNLIQNALKYSLVGGEIDIFQEDDYLIIKNSFQGSLENNKNNLFQPFSRGKNAEDFKYDGMGLGLSIVDKALVLANIEYKLEIINNTFLFKLKLF